MIKPLCLLIVVCSLAVEIQLSAASVPLVNHGDVWRYRKGTNAPQLDWKTASDVALDGTWLSGPGGFGFSTDTAAETNNCLTILSDMRGSAGTNYLTFYMRKTFTISNAVAPELRLYLRMDFDDGFIAWLNGIYLTNRLVTGAPAEPAYSANASSSHESSAGSNGGPVETYDLGQAAALLGVGTNTLAIIGLNNSRTSTDLIQVADLFLDTAITNPPATNGPIIIAADTTWYASNSPIVISNHLRVNAGVTLTIEPGVEVRFNQGVIMTNYGRLLAEGTASNRITFTRNTGATSWNRMEFINGSVTSRIAHADIRYASGSGNITGRSTKLYLDHIVWTNTTVSVLDLHTASIELLHSIIPGIGSSEPIHFSGMPSDGYALFKGNIFGPPSGYNDVIDLTGGNRPGPIAQFIDNVFTSGVDDCFDLDGTDAHIEGNIFLNVHQDATRASTANPISTGADGSNTSELVIVRNIIFDCDHALLIKDFGSATVENNTIVTIRTNSFSAAAAAFINFGEPHRGAPGGRGALLDGNILWDLHSATPFLNFTNASMFFQVNHSIISATNHPGTGNSTNDPLFVNWQAAMDYANVRSNLALLPGSPARGTGPNGLDMGALVPAGASISGEPEGVTTNASATLRVAGPGIYAYRWKLNDGPWSAEVALTNNFLITSNLFANAQPITLSGLTNGSYTVAAIGKNSAGTWQDMAEPTLSKTWIVRLDSDGDGMPDDWEDAHGLNSGINDALDDLDGDGVRNLNEYLSGTLPNDRQSYLKIEAQPFDGLGQRLRFLAVSNQSYTLQSRDQAANGWWSNRVSFPAVPTNRFEEWNDGDATNQVQRFYRLQTPAAP